MKLAIDGRETSRSNGEKFNKKKKRIFRDFTFRYLFIENKINFLAIKCLTFASKVSAQICM